MPNKAKGGNMRIYTPKPLYQQKDEKLQLISTMNKKELLQFLNIYNVHADKESSEGHLRSLAAITINNVF
jgi:hypothetical protein